MLRSCMAVDLGSAAHAEEPHILSRREDSACGV